MDYQLKNNFRSSTGTIPAHWKKPMICPYCGIHTDGYQDLVTEVKYGADGRLYIQPIRCTACGKAYVCLYEKREQNETVLLMVLPIEKQEALHPGLAEMSPRFAEMHRQAGIAKEMGHDALAAMGYRRAMEILLKDYLIRVEGLNEEKVSGLFLADVIREFAAICSPIGAIAADVVRIVGNDYTHYQPKNADCNLDTLCRYYNLMLFQVQGFYDIRHALAVK